MTVLEHLLQGLALGFGNGIARGASRVLLLG